MRKEYICGAISELCTDNAAMIGCAAYYKCATSLLTFLNAVPNLGLDVKN